MNDLSKVIAPKSDQLNADDLIGGPRTITITRVAVTGGEQQPVNVYFHGDDGKPWKPCKSMLKIMVHAWGGDADVYAGRSLTLYREPSVKWGGMMVGGIRISHLSHITKALTFPLTETRGKRLPYTVKPLSNAATQGDDALPVADQITPQERDALQEMISNAGVDVEKVCSAYGVGSLAELTPQQGQKVRAQIARKIEQQKGDGQ